MACSCDTVLPFMSLHYWSLKVSPHLKHSLHFFVKNKCMTLLFIHVQWLARNFSWFLATIVTKPLDSATPISCKGQKFPRWESTYSRFWPLFFAHVQKRHYFYFRSEIGYHNHSQRHWFPVKVLKFWQFDNVLVYFSHIFTVHEQKRLFSSFWL